MRRTAVRAMRSFPDLRGIFRVSHLLHPVGIDSIECFLHRDVSHGIGRGGAMPMLFARRNPNDIAGPDFADRATLGLNPTNARDDIKRLTQRMGMPGCTGT